VPGRAKVDYDNVLADSEREAVADLLNYLENVRYPVDWGNDAINTDSGL